MSIADYIFADATDVSGQDNTDACEGINSISFEQRTLKSPRRLRAKSALVEGGVLAEHLFSTLFSACVSRYLFSSMHSAQLMFDSGSHDTAIWQASQESECKEFP